MKVGRYEVILWIRDPAGPARHGEDYEFHEITAYAGSSLLRALWTVWKSRRRSGCITVKLRLGLA